MKRSFWEGVNRVNCGGERGEETVVLDQQGRKAGRVLVSMGKYLESAASRLEANELCNLLHLIGFI